jgi:hypothetical protein
MFQYFLAGNVSVFGMANKNNGDIGFLNLISSAVVSEFGYTSCGRFDIIGMKGLNRINDYNLARSFNLFEDVLGFGFGKDVAVVTGRGDSFLPALFYLFFFHRNI